MHVRIIVHHVNTHAFRFPGAQYIHLSSRAVDEDYSGHIRIHFATHAQVQQYFYQWLSYAGQIYRARTYIYIYAYIHTYIQYNTSLIKYV